MHIEGIIWQRLSYSRRTGSDVDVREDKQRVLVDDEKSEGVKEQG